MNLCGEGVSTNGCHLLLNKLHVMYAAVALYCIILSNATWRSVAVSINVWQLSKNTSFEELRHQELKDSWQQVLHTAVEVFTFQNNLESVALDHDKEMLVVVIPLSTYAVQRASELMISMSTLRIDIQFITFELGNENVTLRAISKIVDVLWRNRDNINSVLLLSENHTSVTTFLNGVHSVKNMIFTGVLHTTEWIIASPCGSEILPDLREIKIPIDFITLIFRSGNNVTSIAQKSRTEALTIKANISTTGILFRQHNRCCCQKLQGKFNTTRVLRKSALLFLQSQKSILAGMSLPVGLFNDNLDKESKQQNGNRTAYFGYSSELMIVIVHCLGATYNVVAQSDGGYYGLVTTNGTGTGVTGQLGRREVAFSTMPISRLKQRLDIMDYIPVETIRAPMVIMYRISKRKELIDLVYIAIFEPTVLYIMLAPLLAAATIGGILHITTHSCTLMLPRAISRTDLRRLLTYTDHICFQHPSPYPSQTGRVLQASWALTWVIISAAYTTFLVTSFTTKPKEPVFDTFYKLLKNTDYPFGMLGSSTAGMELFKAATDKTLLDFWEKLVQLNKTDARTFSPYARVHVQRIVTERYAWVGSDCSVLGICEDYFSDKLDDIRSYVIEIPEELQNSYIGIPKNVFYKEVLYNLVSNLQEYGILQYIKSRYFSKLDLRTRSTRSRKVENKETEVTFSRIKLLVFAVIAGVCLSTICLGIELAVQRFREK